MADRYMNCSLEAVEKLYPESDWREVFKQRKFIRIPSQSPLNEDDYVKDQPSSVWEIIHRDGITIIENDSFLTDIYKQPDSVLLRPKDIFVVDDTTAELFSDNNTGTCVFKEDKNQLKKLTASWQEPLKRNEKYSWHNFFTDRNRLISTIPSNALIIIDRYLFANPMDAGIFNIKSILSEILPENFSSDYHILIVSDSEQFIRDGKPVSLDDAAKEIYSEINSISRPYQKTIELITIEKLTAKPETKEDKVRVNIYKATHNRKIISNSFIIRAEHGFDAMKVYDNSNKKIHEIQAKYPQNIRFEAIYFGIDNELQILNKLPVKECDDMFELLKLIKAPNGDSIARYFINGKEDHPENIKNRLLIETNDDETNEHQV